MVEPKRLRDGKRFQERVCNAFCIPQPRDYAAVFEHGISHKHRFGRIDIFLHDDADFFAVFEIKATDWDRIKPRNVTKNLWSHQHQLLRYIDKFVEGENLSVTPGIIYPSAPKSQDLRNRIET